MNNRLLEVTSDFNIWWKGYDCNKNNLTNVAYDAWLAANGHYSTKLTDIKLTDEILEAGMDCFVFPIDNGRFSKHDLACAFYSMIEAALKDNATVQESK